MALLCILLAASQASAGGHRSEAWAEGQYTRAEAMREALNGRPTQERTRRDYQRVINAYRSVYYGRPVAGKAEPSVVAVAELMVEMGRRFQDRDILHKAIREYAFLRREYPGSGRRFEALFTIGEIYKDDLNDPKDAEATFREFLRRYPHHHLADQAHKELADAEAGAKAAPDASSAARNEPPDDDSPPDDASGSPASSLRPPAGQPAISDAELDKLPRVTGIRHWSTPDYTRVAIDLEQDVKYESSRIHHPDRIFFDLLDTRLASTLVGKSFDVDDGFLKKIRIAQFEPGRTRIVFEVDDVADYNAFLLSNPSRLVIDIHGKQQAKPATPPDPAKDDSEAAVSPGSAGKTLADAGVKKVIVDNGDSDDADSPPLAESSDSAKPAASRRRLEPKIRESEPTAAGDRSLIRALGLKIGKIVIDPGHGGHDTGTIGPHGLLEKDLVLDVSKRLGKLLETRLGAEVVYTRTDDTFIPLETRTAIANREQADLFISVHANSSSDPDARGIETYYLNFTSVPEALEVAARENAGSEQSIHELQDLVKKIALKEKIEESREFATDVENALHNGLATKNSGIRDRGVKKAPFIVLIGANMPSVLAEISFVSNPTDERKLKTGVYRQRIAESLYRGIAKYVSGLGGVKLASDVGKGAGQ
ncbi:MAG TPA: N-acetylmuramoyl-L-alanine amidase [Terriglobales bacterium]|nr:N-acetylmuramoyl-L-alanine amidase [Terriglobales bacterium]